MVAKWLLLAFLFLLPIPFKRESSELLQLLNQYTRCLIPFLGDWRWSIARAKKVP